MSTPFVRTLRRAQLRIGLGLAAAALAVSPIVQAGLANPTTLAFGGQSMGTTSPALTVTFTNNTASQVAVSGVTSSSAQFRVLTTTCGFVPANGTCNATVAFTPAAAAGIVNSTVAANGTLSFAHFGGPTTVALTGTAEKSLITHYYRSILRRAPDTGGKTFWETEANRMVNLGANVNEAWYLMATSFYFSPEYTALARNNTGFVTDLYATFFNRAPDGAGLAYWTGQLTSGLPREAVLAGFMFSPEFGAFTQGIFGNSVARAEIDTVGDFYRGLLSRLPDSSGFQFWSDQFRSAQCAGAQAVATQADTISTYFIGGPEYTGRGRSNAQFVADLYNAFLRRGADLGGLQFWTGQLAAGMSRDTARLNFVASPEFQARVAAIVAQGCAANHAHPRLWLSDAANFNRMIAAANANSAEWTRLKNFCDTRTVVTSDYQGGEAYRYLGNFALCYRVVRAISGPTAAAPYAQKAVNVLNSNTFPVLTFTAYSTDSGYGIRFYAPTLAIAYDWLFDSPLLTQPMKDAIAAQLTNWLNYYAASGYANDAPISNYHSGYMIAGVMAAIALNGEYANAATIWANALARYNISQAEFDQLMPGGHWPEGWNYGPLSYQSYLLAGAALRQYTGDATFVNGKQWMANNVLLKLNALTPDGKSFYDDGLWSGDNYGFPSTNDMIAAGFTYGWGSSLGRIARNYVGKALANAQGIVLANEEWKGFLLYDATATPADLSTAARSHHASGAGLVVMRSDWTAANATWATVHTGRYLSYQGEQDRDAGHMTLYKGAPLLIDVGHDLYNSDGGIRNSIYHNTFTMEGRNDPTPYTTYVSGQLTYSQECPNPLGTNPIGVNAYVDAGTHVFSSGEYSAAYQNPPIDDPYICGRVPVSWLNRSVLYLRPGVFVVYDQLQKVASQPNLAPTMHWHFAAATTGTARQFSLDNGGARLHFATVFPLTSNSVLVPQPANLADGPGTTNWHLSIAYSSQAPQYQNFLNVMRAGLANASYTTPGTVPVQGTSAFGTLITGLLPEESATPIAAVFADNGTRTIPATVQYQYTSAVPVRNHVAKLKPNQTYAIGSTNVGGVVTVTITEGPTGTATDAGGVLTFTP